MAQVRSLLAGMQILVAEHVDVEPASARVRLANFGAHAVELELFAYIVTSDVSKFLAVREEPLLKIAEIVEAAGTTFAHPTDVPPRDATGAT